jgi:hypothetical protein
MESLILEAAILKLLMGQLSPAVTAQIFLADSSFQGSKRPQLDLL